MRNAAAPMTSRRVRAAFSETATDLKRSSTGLTRDTVADLNAGSF
jgi:hypothetical protein